MGYLDLKEDGPIVIEVPPGLHPKQLEEPVRVMEQTRIYPLGKKETAKPMQFPDASGVPANMLYPEDGTAFDMLARFIDHEYVEPAHMYMRGMAAELAS